MKNLILDGRTAQDIDKRIARVHRDLGYVDGAIDLSEARYLLGLDLQYYASDDPAMLGDMVHKLRIGAKQVIKRPGLLIDAVRKFDLRALFIPDKNQILIDSTLPDLKKRWSEGHEVSHSLIPWHADYMLGDNQATLSPSCHERIEAEANYGSGQLLFPPEPFLEMRRACPLDMARVRALAGHFGNTITSTFWRCIESDENPSFGLIGEHPRRPRQGHPEVEYLIRSPSFEQHFSGFTEIEALARVREYCGYARRGPLGQGEILLNDVAGASHVFLAETFCIVHHTLTLAQYLRPRAVQVVVPTSSLGYSE